MPRRDYINGQFLRLLKGGPDYFNSLLRLIMSAEKIIHLQVYIFEPDTTGRRIISALKQAVQRGVEVYLVVDGFGSYGLKRQLNSDLENSGIHFRFFSSLPFQALRQPARRLHHKICVADMKRALVGGINIADKYFGTPQEKPWLDYAVYTEGSICQNIHSFCEHIYVRRFLKRRFPSQKKTEIAASEKVGISVRLSINDWLRRKNEISASYKHMLNSAHHDIIIVASYFLPTRRLLKILLRAAKRNRKISIVLSGYSDVPFIKPAMLYLYGKLLNHQIRIFEYHESVLHAKVCVVDQRWTSIGSHNLNQLSEFFSVEANLEILDKKFASGVSEELKELMSQHCLEVDRESFQKSHHLFRRAWNRFSYSLISVSMRILDFFNVRE